MNASPRFHTDKDFDRTLQSYVDAAAADQNHENYCHLTRLAVLRHQADLEKSKEKDYPYRFDPAEARRVCRFVEKMPHVEGQWDTENLFLSDWQVFVYSCVFGWRRKSDGYRRFTDVYIEVPRKNGKSSSTAPIALYCLTCEDEPGPLCLCAATTGAQAEKVFNPALFMTKRRPGFRTQFGLETLQTKIRCHSNDGVLTMINSDSNTQDGHNAHFACFDELHAHPNRNLYDVIHSGAGARPNELFWVITTAGISYEGVCYELRQLTESVLRGHITLDHHFGIVFTIDEGESIFDEKVWHKANPQLHVEGLVSDRLRKKLKELSEEAKVSAERRTEFKRKRLNVWVDSENPYFNVDLWRDNCTLDEMPADLLKRLPCYGGLDLASTQDFCAFALAWPDFDNDLLYVNSWLWMPEDHFREVILTSPLPYRSWREKKFFRTTRGSSVDYSIITDKIVELSQHFTIHKIAFDPWNANQTSNDLQDKGFEMEQFRQSTANYNAAMKEWDRRIINSKLRHLPNETMTWMLGNVVARVDVNENVAPNRDKSKDKIDGVVAGLMATALAYNEPKPPQSVDELVMVV